MARQATGAAIDEAAAEAADPETRSEIAAAVTDPELGAAASEITREVTGAVLDEAADAERAEQLGRAVLGFFASEEAQAHLASVASGLSHAVTKGLAEGLEQDLGPAMERVLEENVARGATAALQNDFGDAMGSSVQKVAHAAVRGTDAGVSELMANPKSALSDLQRETRQGIGLLQIGALLLALVVVVLGALLWRATVRARRAQKEGRDLEAAILLLTTAVKSAEGRPWARELMDVLRRELRDKEGAAVVRDVLRRHPALRLQLLDEA